MNFKTFGQILREMVDYLAGIASPLTDFSVGSGTRSFFEAIALVLAEIHYIGQQLISRFFVSTTTGQWLDMRAAEYALARVQSTATRRGVIATHGAGSPAVTLPVGQQFQTVPGASVEVVYQVEQDTILPAGAASVSVPVISTTTGSATAIPDGSPLRQVGTPLAYVETLTTAATTTTGTDREADASLQRRILDRLQHPPGPGNASDYEQVVLNHFAGVVESVTVIPLWDGPGTVLLLILGPNNTLPSVETVAAVQAFVDGWAPVGSVATVAAPTAVAVDVRATLTLGTHVSWTDVEAHAHSAVAAYLDTLPTGADALLAAVGDALWRTAGIGGTTGLDGGNYANLQMRIGVDDFAAVDIVVGDQGKAIGGVVTLSPVA